MAMALVATLIAGLDAALKLPLRRMPDVDVPRVIVEAEIPGLPASAVRSLVALPLEDALASAKGLVKSSSVSRYGRAMLALDFRWGEAQSKAAGRVREIIDAVYQTLPEEASRPQVLPYDPGAEALVVASVYPRNGDLAFARFLAEYEARARLRRVDGAGAVVVVGGAEREVAVAVDMRRAQALGLTVTGVARTIAAENADLPSGSVREGNLELVAIAKGRAPDLDSLAALIAPGPSGPFRLSDIASVRERNAPRESVFVADGQERVALELYPRPGADPVATAREARKVIVELAERFARDADIRLVSDASTRVSESIRSLAISGAVGAAAAALALFLLLRDAMAAALVAATIPLSVAATLAVLSALGLSLNGMTLGGMGLAVGMISDNAVVMLDALATRFSGTAKRPSPEEIAEAAGGAVAGTFGGMATTAVVFVPVFFLPGAIGGLFGELAVSIIAANVSGWLAAVLALPAAYRVFWSARPTRPKAKLERAYRRALSLALRHPAALIASALVAAIGGSALVATRPVSFMPLDAATELELVAVFPSGTGPDGVAGAAVSLSRALAGVQGTAGAYGSAGAESDDAARRADPGYAMEALSMRCPLKPGADAGATLSRLLIEARAVLPAGVTVSARIPADPAASLLGLDSGSTLAARGAGVEEARRKADELCAALGRELGGSLASVTRNPSGSARKITVRPDRHAQAALGVNLVDMASELRAATEGVSAAKLEAGGKEIGIRVFAAGAGKAGGGGSLGEAAAIPVGTEGGGAVPAGSVARFERVDEEAALARLDRYDAVYLEPTAAPGGEKTLGKVIGRLIANDSDISRIDESAFRRYGGAMAGAAAFVVILLYLTLGAQFESFTLPFAIMATIPLALAGVGPALVVLGIGLDSGSILGLIVLFGVAVNNAILLYESTGARLVHGASAAAAAYAGASERVRPVLATTLTTVIALFPICLSRSAAVQRSMAVAMLGGLAASTALTLFVSPLLFSKVGRRRTARR